MENLGLLRHRDLTPAFASLFFSGLGAEQISNADPERLARLHQEDRLEKRLPVAAIRRRVISTSQDRAALLGEGARHEFEVLDNFRAGRFHLARRLGRHFGRTTKVRTYRLDTLTMYGHVV